MHSESRDRSLNGGALNGLKKAVATLTSSLLTTRAPSAVVTHIILYCGMCEELTRLPVEKVGESRLAERRCPHCHVLGHLHVAGVALDGRR